MNRPTIFVSCVSPEFGKTRQTVANLLIELGYTPVFQEAFGAGHGDLLGVIKRKIDESDGLIQIVGSSYGAEPPMPDHKYGRVSYTQFEFLYALDSGKKTWLLFANESCLRDRQIDSLDLPADPNHPDPAGYQRERQELQRAYARLIRQKGHYRHAVTREHSVEMAVLRMRDELAELRRSFRRWQALVMLVLLLLAAVGLTGIYWQKRTAEKVQEGATELRKQTEVLTATSSSATKIENEVARIGEKLDKISSPAAVLQLVSAPDSAAVLRPVGLENLAKTPVAFSALPKAQKSVILNQAGRSPRWIALPIDPTESMSIELRPATIPVPGKHYRSELLDADMLWVAPGRFQMGSPAEERGGNVGERPVSEVTISRGFWVARHELTNREAALFQRDLAEAVERAPRDPVVGLTWHEALAFCENLTRFERENGRLPADLRYDLPTEAEWEYACRAATSTPFFYGSTVGDAGHYGWDFENSGGRIHPVGEKAASPMGLHDIYGNAEEWCRDWYGGYAAGQVLDPSGPRAGTQRVARGGSYLGISLRDSRSASRQRHAPSDRLRHVGMRLVLRIHRSAD